MMNYYDGISRAFGAYKNSKMSDFTRFNFPCTRTIGGFSGLRCKSDASFCITNASN